MHRLAPERFETAQILKRLNIASRNLAELKGVAASIPNQNILINTLTLQEARCRKMVSGTISGSSQGQEPIRFTFSGR